ncbi:hypothetical protein JOC95_003934 [Bacillus tianshenii]|uniref:Uncharacterized protein n=1 Tax=Sutcliffiella tianshenii TaxID=1463404 RepID=A0ABS2P574_9BACI|nr:hypothetical protein [Bacillus tianshenii]MBM7622024.1 hypothetical protein [Bacillus tianshenii]
MSENPKIPKLELDKFTFSPPGPMGWNMAEYEQLLENPDQLVLNEDTVNSQLHSLKGIQLVEFSMSGELRAKHTAKTLRPTEEIPEIIMEEPGLEGKASEEEAAEEIIEVPTPSRKRVTIIIKETSLKTPWISPIFSKTQKNR